MTSQVVQLAGALLVLLGYLLAQAGSRSPSSFRYLLPNLLGSSLLAGDAFYERQWGFVLLEGVWALVSAWSLVEKLCGAEPPAVAH
ncbi:MAG TPA: hypothetical protein VLD16_06390 [Gaiellaceae bacterium]|nr:hypothetical protein [Gaiellaceae bacterium]